MIYSAYRLQLRAEEGEISRLNGKRAMTLLFLLLLLVAPYSLLTLAGRYIAAFNIAPSTRENRTLAVLRFHGGGAFYPPSRNVRHVAGCCPVPHRDHLSYWHVRVARSYRCVDTVPYEVGRFLAHSDADMCSPR